MNHIIALLMGVLLLVGSVWIRHGGARARFWLPKKKKDISRSGLLIMDERWVLVFLPALGLFFLAIGAVLPAYATPKPWSYLLLTVCVICAICGLVGIVWGLTNLYFPEGLRPAWLRDYYQHLGFSPSRGTRLAPQWYREQMEGEHLENPRLSSKPGRAGDGDEESRKKSQQNRQNRKKRRPR